MPTTLTTRAGTITSTHPNGLALCLAAADAVDPVGTVEAARLED